MRTNYKNHHLIYEQFTLPLGCDIEQIVITITIIIKKSHQQSKKALTTMKVLLNRARERPQPQIEKEREEIEQGLPPPTPISKSRGRPLGFFFFF